MTKTKDKSGFQLYTEADSPTGVDDYLLLKQLRMTPAERLDWAEKALEQIVRFRSNAVRISEG